MELQRLLTMRGVSLSLSAEAVICLQLAASVTGDTCDKVCAIGESQVIWADSPVFKTPKLRPYLI